MHNLRRVSRTLISNSDIYCLYNYNNNTTGTTKFKSICVCSFHVKSQAIFIVSLFLSFQHIWTASFICYSSQKMFTWSHNKPFERHVRLCYEISNLKYQISDIFGNTVEIFFRDDCFDDE